MKLRFLIPLLLAIFPALLSTPVLAVDVSRYVSPYETAFTISGATSPGDTLTFFVTDTATPALVYTTAVGDTPLGQPVTAGSDGIFPEVFLDADIIYRVTWTRSDATTLTVDDIAPGGGGAVKAVEDYDALKALGVAQLSEGRVFSVESRDIIDDGGQGDFYSTQSNPGADNDGTLLHSDTAGWFFVRLFTEPINVLWFGVDTTGAVASSTELQATIDALPSTGGEVDLTGGTIKLDIQITVPPRVYLLGRGANATRLNSSTSLSPFLFTDAGGPSGVYEGGGMRDVSLSLDSAAIGIECVDIWGLEFSNIRFRDGGAATLRLIKASGQCFEMRIQDNRMAGFTTAGVDLQGISNSSVITGNDFVAKTGSTTAKSIVVKDANHAYIHGNRFEYAGSDAGTKIELENSDNTVVHGNSIQVSTSLQGVLINGTSKFTSITDNKFSTSGTASGVVMEGTSKNAAIGNNHFELSSATDGILINGQPRVAITGNTFEIDSAISGAAISIATGSNSITVTGNVIEGDNESTPLGGTGILLASGALRNILQSNVVRNMTTGINSAVTSSTPGNTVINNITNNNTTDLVVAKWSAISHDKGWIKHLTEHLSVSSGTTLDWTSIPDDVTQIKIVFRNHSAAAAEDFAIRLGDASSFETTGYVGRVRNATAGTDWSAMAIMTNAMAAAAAANGEFRITNIQGNVWAVNGISTVVGAELGNANGSKSLTGVLTRVRLLMVSGTTFDGTDADYVLYYQ